MQTFNKKLRKLACQTPTTAFAMRITKMTKGSTKAVTRSRSSSSKNARTWNIISVHRKKKKIPEDIAGCARERVDKHLQRTRQQRQGEF